MVLRFNVSTSDKSCQLRKSWLFSYRFVLLLLLLETLCTLIYFLGLLFLYPSSCCYHYYNFSDNYSVRVCVCVCVCHLTEQVQNEKCQYNS